MLDFTSVKNTLNKIMNILLEKHNTLYIFQTTWYSKEAYNALGINSVPLNFSPYCIFNVAIID